MITARRTGFRVQGFSSLACFARSRPVAAAVGSTVLAVLGCGASFDVSNETSGDSAGNSSSSADMTQSDADDSGGSNTNSTLPRETACGLPRGEDAQSLDAELCISEARYVMGSSEPLPTNSQGLAVHSPEHEVIVQSFFLDVHEVTVARYRGCVEADGCVVPRSEESACTYSAEPGTNELLPITCVSWSEARSFCEWDGARRLPTEAEWELAARGVAGRKYAWGDQFDCGHAVVASSELCSEYDTALPLPVGSLARGQTPEGAFDLTGNAAEWVADWAGTYPASLQTNPLGPNSGGAKAVRGASWRDIVAHTPAYVRRSLIIETRGTTGFRCARDASAQ